MPPGGKKKQRIGVVTRRKVETLSMQMFLNENHMEIKDKKLVSVLVGIIVILAASLGMLYYKTSQRPEMGDLGNPPTGMQGGTPPTRSGNTGAKTDTNSAATDTDAASSASAAE